MSDATTLFPFEPLSMSPALLAAVSYLARYAGRTHTLVRVPAAPLVLDAHPRWLRVG